MPKEIEKKSYLFDVDPNLINNEKTKNLAGRFLLPPFSILNTRDGFWQDRSREWKSLGIKSEIGRGDNLTFNTAEWEEKKSKTEFGKCNPDMGDQWEKYGRKPMNETSIFDPVLCELVYKWFANKGFKVLDPFAGGSVRGITAAVCGLQYTGIDLSTDQVEANREQANEIGAKYNAIMCNLPNWINGDSNIVLDNLAQDKYDLVFSCPPYYNLEVYGEKEGDLSNAKDYKEFLAGYYSIIAKACAKLEDNRFACFVVGNLRDDNGNYYDLAGDTIRAFEAAGLHYYNEMILVNSAGTLPIRITKQFNSGRKIGKCHQNILVFFKGDNKQIKSIYGEVCIE